MTATATFKPTRRELNRVQYLATECEIDLKATLRLAAQGSDHWYGIHRPALRAAEAFALSTTIAARAGRSPA